MRRLLPRSLVAQLALAIGVVLLVAQLINFALILNDRQRLSFAQNEAPAIARFVNMAAELTPLPQAERERLLYARQGGRRFRLSDVGGIEGATIERNLRLEARIRTAAADVGVRLGDIRAGIDRTPPPQWAKDRSGRRRDGQLMLISAEIAPQLWLQGRIMTPRPDPWLAARLGGATLLLYVLVLGTMILLAARIAGPLRELAVAAKSFGGGGDTPFVDPRGPSDLADAIDAFNEMNRRVASLLAEKDYMLGALSHDLRTPLASLRIRAESIEPEEERARAIATIEEMTGMLEDSLLLARAGHARGKASAVDIGALAEVVVEEFRELGSDVRLVSEGRQIACVNPALLRRAIRNLVDNALKYGGSGQIFVHAGAGNAIIDICDGGPGIPEDELQRVQEPFFRLEASRNRATGGSGLGLTIAKAIVEGAGGTLRLSNRDGGGLSAKIALPLLPGKAATN